MTNYYVGYKQGNDEYVYVNSVTYSNVGVTTIMEGAISFEKEETAESFKNSISTLVANQEYIVLKITTKIEEVDK